MLCALTVRKLKPGAMEDFKRAFIPPEAPRRPRDGSASTRFETSTTGTR